MDKIFISNQIKLEILKICGHPTQKAYNLPGSLRIEDLDYKHTKNVCSRVAEKLQEIAAQYRTGKIILKNDISEEYTVSDCIKLVFAAE